MNELPKSLLRFDRQLERAIERDIRQARVERRRPLVLRLAVAAAAAGAIAFGASSLTGENSPVGGPSVVGLASAHERAAAVLSPAHGSIVHELASYRHVSPDGGVSRWQEETWRATSRPYARRQVTTRPGGVRVETAIVGARPASLYDAATDTIYTNPPSSGPALGTPMPATDGDPLRAQLLSLLRSDDARDATETTRRGRPAIRFELTDGWPDGSRVEWTYVIDADDYAPIELTASTAEGRTTARFERYETLEATERGKALLSLRAQHPGAAIDTSEAGYAAAQARVHAPALGAGG